MVLPAAITDHFITTVLVFLILALGFITTAEHTEALPLNTYDKYVMIDSKKLNLRSQPGTHGRVLKVLTSGTYLPATGNMKNGWVEVHHWDGTTGWVSGKYVQLSRYSAANLQAPRHTSTLQAAINTYINDLKRSGQMDPRDHLFFVVQDLYTGERVVSINPTEQVKAASLIKVPILHAYMLERYRGNIRHTSNLRRHLVRMIRFSSNYSTNKIVRLLGGPSKVQRLLKETGYYENIHLVEYIPANGRTYKNKISAEDLNHLYYEIWNGQVLGDKFSAEENREASEKMLYYLGLDSTSRAKDRLKDGTCFAHETSTRIWDKTGFVRGLNGDAGVIEVSTPQGRRAYSIIGIIDRHKYWSVRGNGNSWAFQQSRLLRKLSEMTYAYFKNQYGATTTCGLDRLRSYAGTQFALSNSTENHTALH